MSHGSLQCAILAVVLCCSAGSAAASTADPGAAGGDTPAARATVSAPVLDRTGRKRVGKASFYARRFSGKKMADGTPMQPHSNNAASKTLPLGTTAKVTNLDTGQSAVVTIKDRGPYVKGRILDVSPSTAQRIGLDKDAGTAKVEVAPIAVPMADGTLKPGAAAGEPTKH